MNEVLRNQLLKANYYALLLAITGHVSAKEALIRMGISPDNRTEELMKCQIR